MRNSVICCVVLTITLEALLTVAQLPPRLSIPGAVLLQPARPVQFRQQRILQQPFSDSSPLPQRPRKLIPNAIPIPVRETRPVVEEPEEIEEPRGHSSVLDDEVAKFAAFQNVARQNAAEEETETARPLQFRPERPVPVLRQDVREQPRPVAVRQDFRDDPPIPVRQQAPIRQIPQVRHQAPPPQPIRQPQRQQNPRPQQYIDDEEERRNRLRKPPVQILKKYRTDNEDGSITWGFENEDGTFKEENIGADCIIRGKYGYIDPEGTRREYSYEAGNKCEEPEEELPLEELQPKQVFVPRPGHKQPQYRPLPIQN